MIRFFYGIAIFNGKQGSATEMCRAAPGAPSCALTKVKGCRTHRSKKHCVKTTRTKAWLDKASHEIERLNRLFNAKSNRRFDVAIDHGLFNPFRVVKEHTLQGFKSFAQNCKITELVRISSQTKMLSNHISIIRTRPLGRIDNVALKRWALFTVE
jgi:hypothetical protein